MFKQEKIHSKKFSIVQWKSYLLESDDGKIFVTKIFIDFVN